MKDLIKIFQVAAVFIGTIVGAGLASGKEITHFFTSFGLPSFFGIILCGLFYILFCSIISDISQRYRLRSYSDVIKTVSPNLLGKFTGIITTLYLISSASIILAGSGALLNQFFGIPKIVGSLIMALVSVITLTKGTNGLIGINSLIVPSLIITITTIFIMYIFFGNSEITLEMLKGLGSRKSNWLTSTILYAGYNILCCCGVLVPLSTEIKKKSHMFWGITIGSIGLTFLCIAINFMLMINQPYIYEYQIPLLYIADRFGRAIQVMLMIIIWCEMFSTEVSDVFSISKTLEDSFKIKYKHGIFLVIGLAIPISQVGFSNLIESLYPMFGLLSLIFIFQCIYFYIRKCKS
ncbi:YkvI family membrane protein [Clostridium fallax]|uniref:Uncharacterized membrane protein YkvI n=1 Tax=Clostridium fallax TaxID=1533 RepID=A0A1M4T7Z7_9CLOT|nr:transporter [Clostridium fallax]SHE40458.1 Uncharacterized membrane protein YkvI [Clostridium fallax]SQB22637.1 transporter [Clostridium fallax]